MASLDQACPPLAALDLGALTLAAAAALPADEVLVRLKSGATGLSRAEASARLAEVGTNALRTHGARPLAVLARQLRNPLSQRTGGRRACGRSSRNHAASRPSRSLTSPSPGRSCAPPRRPRLIPVGRRCAGSRRRARRIRHPGFRPVASGRPRARACSCPLAGPICTSAKAAVKVPAGQTHFGHIRTGKLVWCEGAQSVGRREKPAVLQGL